MVDYLDFAKMVGGTQSPLESLQKGQDIGLARQLQAQQIQSAMAQQQMAAQQQQMDMQRKQQQAEAMQRLMSTPNPSARDIFNASLLMDKDTAESMRKSFDVLDKDTQKSNLEANGKVLSAFEVGKPEYASELLKNKAEAARNSGDEQSAKFYDVLAQNALENPHATQLTIGMLTSHMPGGKDVMEAVGKRGEEVRKQEIHPLELKKQEADLKQQAAQLGLTKAQTNKIMIENTTLPKQLAANLGLTQAQTQNAIMSARKTALEMATAQNPDQQKEQATLTAQQAINQANIVLQHPGRKLGTGVTSIIGAIPGTEAKGFQAQLETFKAQTFIPMVSALKGMGALSDAEGKKLSASVGALDPSMPSAEFEKSLKDTMDYLYKKAKISGLNVTNPMEQQAQTTSLPSGWKVTVR